MRDYLQEYTPTTLPKIAVLARYINNTSVVHNVSLKEVIDRFCALYKIIPAEFFHKTRKREKVLVWQKAMWLCWTISKRNNNCYTLMAIGKMVGEKHHATVLHSYKTINDLLETNKTMQQEIKKLACTFNIKL